MNFGEALAALKEGKKVTRSVWGGYWQLLEFSDFTAHPQNGLPGQYFSIKNFIIAVLKDDADIAPAQPYQEDLLANDWLIIE